MWSSRFIIRGLILLITLLLHKVEGTCRLKIENENKPLLTQKFGSKEIIIQSEDYIDLDENDEIQAYCGTGFKPFYYSQYNRNVYESAINMVLKFFCKSNRVEFSPQYSDEFNIDGYSDNNPQIIKSDLNEEIMPQCSGTTYAMFESEKKLPNCEDASSYALGAKLNTPIIIAALCYDLDKLKLKYVSYKLHEPTSILEKLKQFYPTGLDDNSLSFPLKKIDHLFRFPSDFDIRDDLEMQAKTNFWLQIANYELDNIIQTKTRGLKHTLDQFSNFFNIIWWKNLRTGNWQRFMQLLDKRSRHAKYNVYTGTSGKLHVPVEKLKCENVTNIELELSVAAVIPQFVWTYLQTLSEETVEDFFVIAYNSPYFENFAQNSTVICNDMCDEIDWLQPIQDSRHVAAFGRLYCCRYDEVVGLLDNFPLKSSNSTYLPTEATTEK